jgi:signal peptidase I
MKNVSHSGTMRSELADWVFNIIVLLFATSTIAQPFVIPSGSMEKTLMTGDHLIVDRLAYSPHGSTAGKVLPYSEVKHGDIIVFRWPVDLSQNLVKRAIGLPGDRIRIEGKDVYRNGIKLVEPYVQHIDSQRMPFRDDFPSAFIPSDINARARSMLQTHVLKGEVVVPEGNYFAMGDNRDNSSDSRFWGFVPRENIIGKPWIIYWSYEAPTEDLLEYNTHHIVDVATHFFTKTRWDRTFMLVHPAE